MDTVFLDFESYFGTGCSLSSLSYSEYIHHPEFRVHGATIAGNYLASRWYEGNDLTHKLHSIDWDNATLVAHNVLFDAAVLAWHYGIQAARYECTMAFANHLLPEVPANLNELSTAVGYDGPTKESLSAGLAKTYNKQLADLTDDEHAALIAYALNDVDAMRHIYTQLRPHMPKQELWLLHHTVTMALNPTLEFDYEQAKRAAAADAKERKAIVASSGYKATELRKNDTLAVILTEHGVEPPMQYSTAQKKKVYAFAKDNEEFLKLTAREDQVGAIARARLAAQSSIVRTRLDRMRKIADCHDGKVPVMYKYHAAHTGRAGGANKANLANLPRTGGVRECLVAPDGYTLVIVDSSNIEARMTAWIAGCEDELTAYRQGRDVYCELASEVFGRTITKDDKFERGLGKVARLGLGFGMGKAKFDRTLRLGPMGMPPVHLPEEQVSNIVDVFRQKYPEIVRCWYTLNSFLPTMASGIGTKHYRMLKFGKGKIRLPSWRCIYFPNLQPKGKEWVYGSPPTHKVYGGKLLENVVQSLARDVVMHQMLWIENRLRATHYGSIVMHTYDEVVCCVKEEFAGETLQFMLHAMSTAPNYCDGLPLDAEGLICPHFTK